jgi:hypothetical protein
METQDDSEPYLDLNIISNVKFVSSFFAVLCQNKNNEKEFFQVLFWNSTNLVIGNCIRIYKPMSQFNINSMKTIICTYFTELLNESLDKKKLKKSLELFEKMKKLNSQKTPSTPTKQRKKKSINTPQKTNHHPEIIREKEFLDIFDNISLIPLCDEICFSIRISGVIQRVIRAEEPDRESEDDKHINFLKFNHTIILQESQTKKICLLKIPFGEFEYWDAVFNSEGRLFEFRSIRLVKKTLVTSKRIKSMIESFTQDFIVFEFHVQLESTCKLFEMDTQMTQSEYQNNPIDSMYIPFPSLTVDEILNTNKKRFDVICSISRIRMSLNEKEPLCILYVQDKQSIENKTQ